MGILVWFSVAIGGGSASGDPHFTVPLVSSNDTLCYSIQGYAGLAFNLIFNSHLTVNALFTDSINDTKEVTWISKLAVIFHTSGQAIIFDSTHQQVFIPSMGKLKASIVKQTFLKESGQFVVKFNGGSRMGYLGQMPPPPPPPLTLWRS